MSNPEPADQTSGGNTAPEQPGIPPAASTPQAQLFNFETMSGVFPGTRTPVFQRVRLVDSAQAPDETADAPTWAKVLWTDSPAAAVILPLDMAASQATGEPLATLFGTPGPELATHMNEALATRGRYLATCGTCAHWHPGQATTVDGLPLGACTLRRRDGETVDIPPGLAAQSLLALDCPHWLRRAEQLGDRQGDATNLPDLPTAPLPKIAEISDSKKPWLTRMGLRIKRALRPPAQHPSLTQALVERSGVGAGTEPCFSCQGRIANLGALTVDSPEGDKQTFSLWRCRICYSLYLSDWTDRWERVDSLETEEKIYRIAPVEAAELLAVISSVQGGDHPRLRRERGPQRTWILQQLEQRPLLSHLIKQGR